MWLSLSTTTEGPLWRRKLRWWWEEGKRDRSAAELGGVVSPSHRVISSISGFSVNTRKQYNFIIVSCKFFFYCPTDNKALSLGDYSSFILRWRWRAVLLPETQPGGRDKSVTAYLIICLTPEFGVQSCIFQLKVLSWINTDTCSASSKAHMAERAYR